MAVTLPGYTVRLLAVADAVEDLVAQEEALPAYTRVIIEASIDPSKDVSQAVQEIQAACEESGVLYWPENKGTYVAFDDHTVYIMYMKSPDDDVSPAMAIGTILLIIGIVAPIIMYFAIPGFADLINSIMMLVVVMFMCDLMSSIQITQGPPSYKPPREPIEQRISKKIESIADSIVRVENSLKKTKSVGESTFKSVLSDIKGVARAIEKTPSTVMSAYEKSMAASRLDALDDKIEKYKQHLSPSQLKAFEEEQRIIRELRNMYG